MVTKKQHELSGGFTLVELAISLMVIGLLIGGVLKGQELIENARITQTLRQLKAYDAGAMIFYNTYGALPGDIKRPNRVPNCTEEICNTPGNGNGRVDSYGEDRHFFAQLIAAGIIKPTSNDTQASQNGPEEEEMFSAVLPIDYFVIPYYVRAGAEAGSGREHIRPGHYWALDKPVDDEGSWIPGRIMMALDNKADDGRPLTGGVVVSMMETECPIDLGDNEYDLTYANNWQECYFLMSAGF